MHLFNNQWVSVHPRDEQREGQKIWVRLQDVERVDVRPRGGGSSSWIIHVGVKGEAFEYDESKFTRDSAQVSALKLLEAVELACGRLHAK
jgi:hypothetical protein